MIYDPRALFLLGLRRWLRKMRARVCARLKRPICIYHFLAALPDFSPSASFYASARRASDSIPHDCPRSRPLFFIAATSQRVSAGVRIKRQPLDRNRPLYGAWAPRCMPSAATADGRRAAAQGPHVRGETGRSEREKGRGGAEYYFFFSALPSLSLSLLSWL